VVRRLDDREHTVDNMGLYVMSIAADLMGLHPSTLRLWERRGLIAPSRTPGGTRLYSDADLHRMRRIAELAQDGVNLEGIRRILTLEDELAALRTSIGPPTTPNVQPG
jgi:MerR family transcriptional regulator, heat shock protein HspR